MKNITDGQITKHGLSISGLTMMKNYIIR